MEPDSVPLSKHCAFFSSLTLLHRLKTATADLQGEAFQDMLVNQKKTVFRKRERDNKKG